MLDIPLIFIVNGEDVLVTTSLLAPLHIVRNVALLQSNNTGRPLDEWDVRNESGALVDSKRTVNRHGFEPNTRLFLTLPVGKGGGQDGCAGRMGGELMPNHCGFPRS